MNNIDKVDLIGNDAFYKQADYALKTLQDLNSPTPLTTCNYRYETESRAIRILKIVLACLVFPIGIAWGIHALVGKGVVPVLQNPRSNCEAINNFVHDSALSRAEAHEKRRLLLSKIKEQPKPNSLIYKRVTVEVNGNKIDAMIVGTPNTINKGRWVLQSLGNAEDYEQHLLPPEGSKNLKLSSVGKMVSSLDANVLIFNYPGKGSSEGFRERSNLINTYNAMLSYLEDQKQGLAAREIVLYGHSIGTTVQQESLETHELKPGIKYVAVKSRGPSSVSAAATGITGSKVLGAAIEALGWNMKAKTKQPKCPEIILQTVKELNPRQLQAITSKVDAIIAKYADQSHYDPQGLFMAGQVYRIRDFDFTFPDMQISCDDVPRLYDEIEAALDEVHFSPLTDIANIAHDTIFPPEATLAKTYLEEGALSKQRRIIGISAGHNDAIQNLNPLAKLIKEDLAA